MIPNARSEARGGALPGAPHGLDAFDACATCRVTSTSLLRRLPSIVVAELQGHTIRRAVAAGEIIDPMDRAACAIYVIRKGRVKIRDGARVVKICGRAEILGVGSLTSGQNAFEARALDACLIDVVSAETPRLRDALSSAITTFSEQIHLAPRTQAFVLSGETLARLVRALVDWGWLAGDETADGTRISLRVSPPRIAESLALPLPAVQSIFEELELRSVLYTETDSVTILPPRASAINDKQAAEATEDSRVASNRKESS